MKKVFGVFMSVFVILALTACGMTEVPEDAPAEEAVEEAPESVVTLEIQVISSEPDYVPVELVEVRNNAGSVVASARGSINRLVEFELPRGKYSVSAKITGYKGPISMEREVDLASDSQVIVDLTELVYYNLFVEAGGVSGDESRLSILEGESRHDSSIVLQVEEVELTVDILMVMPEDVDSTGFMQFQEDTFNWFFRRDQRLRPGISKSIQVDLMDVDYCGLLGTYRILWNGEGVTKEQVFNNTPTCPKG